MRLIKLKQLEVGQAEIALPCPFQYTIISWLLSGTCGHLESRKIKNPVFLAELFYSNPVVEFPQLETISIPNLPHDGGPECIQRLLRSAPNLKRIMVRHEETLKDLRPDKYNLLVKITFQVKAADPEQLFRRIVEALISYLTNVEFSFDLTCYYARRYARTFTSCSQTSSSSWAHSSF